VEKEALAVRTQILDAEEERREAKTALHRTLFVKNKVEGLCNSLQQQTQVLVDERKRLIEQERRRRQELADGFQNTISDVKKKMDEQALERARLAKENEDLRSRFKQFFEQYDRREKELLEQQKTGAAETEAFEKKYADQHYLWRQATHREQMAQQDNEELLATEKALRDQLQTYTGKFNQFQDALSKSEKVLGQYKRQRNKIQRRVEGLVKENAELRARNDKKNQAAKRELEAALRDKDEAQEKCKMLQAELIKQRTHGGG
jgi:regulator of replication initiation timing